VFFFDHSRSGFLLRDLVLISNLCVARDMWELLRVFLSFISLVGFDLNAEGVVSGWVALELIL
jgi:hypothetical protein